MEEQQYKSALVSLQGLCARRECCSFDIFRKALKLADGDESAAQSLVESLKEDSFLNDGRYASAYAREKSSVNGWGPAKIRQSLRTKFIDRRYIEEAIAQIDTDSADRRMLAVMESKWKLLAGDPYAKFKLIRFALTRGYDYDRVAKVADRLAKTLEE